MVHTSSAISAEALATAMTYEQYRQLIENLLQEGKTTGPVQNEAMRHYTEMNHVRMRRLDKTTRLSEDSLARLQAIQRPMIWLSLTEGWCGDAAQILPVIARLAEASDKVEARFILRDEHLDIMDQFLTNGGRSIPKTIILDAETLEVLGDWGPRPAAAQQLMHEAKAKMLATDHAEEKKAIFEAVKTELQLWYAKDKTRSIQAEFLSAAGL